MLQFDEAKSKAKWLLMVDCKLPKPNLSNCLEGCKLGHDCCDSNLRPAEIPEQEKIHKKVTSRPNVATQCECLINTALH